MKHVLSSAAIAASVWLAVASSAYAQKSDDLANLSVDDLMKVEVTSIARRGQRLSETPAATFIISQEDIRRSGATNIPELLRMVPGFDVAQISRDVWAVSARGFNSRWANKLLVLIDGRSVYDDMNGGVRWDVVDVALEDVDRIEVTRGPGGTLWGANAVNGIINIITKRPIDTQGTLASMSHGEGAGPGGLMRYGGRFGETGHFRASLKGFDAPATLHTDGAVGGNDAWQLVHGGFRAEWTTSRGSMNLQGDVYRGVSGETVGYPTPAMPYGWYHSDPGHTSGHDLLFRWSSAQSTHSETTLTAYYSEDARNQWTLDERQRTFDAELQHHLTLGRHNATWGVGVRTSAWHFSSSSGDIFLPNDVSHLFSAFVQDELRVSSRLSITAGAKFLHDGGLHETQPTVRAVWTLGPNRVLWAAETRSVRLPSEVESDVVTRVGAVPLGGGQEAMLTVFGDRTLRPEHDASIELGYREVVTRFLSIDVTAYRSRMRDVIAPEAGSPEVKSAELILPYVYGNALDGQRSGIEILTMIRPSERWDLTLGYTQFSMSLVDRIQGDVLDDLGRLDVPRHQYSLRSFLTLTPRLELDAAAYYTGAIASQGIPRYVRTDARVAWQLTPTLELSVTGRNLTDSRHPEMPVLAERAAVTPTSRTITGMVVWRP